MTSKLVLEMEKENARVLSASPYLTLEQGTQALINYFELSRELDLLNNAQTEEK